MEDSLSHLEGLHYRNINYFNVREDFKVWLESRDLSRDHQRQILGYLERFLAGRVIGNPMDVVRLFQVLSSGQRNNLNRALRNLFNFFGRMEWPTAYLDLLRKNIPRDQLGEDLYRPSEGRILESLRLMNERANEKYRLLYWVVIKSGGLRLVEAVKLYNNLEDLENEELPSGYIKVLLGYFRGTKRAYYAYLSCETYKRILESSAKIPTYPATRVYLKQGLQGSYQLEVSQKIRLRQIAGAWGSRECRRLYTGQGSQEDRS